MRSDSNSTIRNSYYFYWNNCKSLTGFIICDLKENALLKQQTLKEI